MAIGIFKPFFDLITDPNMGSAIEIVGLGILIGALLKLSSGSPELLDLAHTRPFWRSSLVFDNPARKISGVFEDLDRHEVRKVFKEVEGRDLKAKDGAWFSGDAMAPARKAVRDTIDSRSGAAFSRDTRVRTEQGKIRRALEEPRLSPRFLEEKQQIKAGTLTDLTDFWILLSADSPDHALFASVDHVHLDPSTGTLAFRILQHDVAPEKLGNSQRLFRLKQDTYDFLQVVSQEIWMRPYVELAALIECTWYYKSDEVFDSAAPAPLFCSSITLAELAAHRNRFFNPNDLHTELLCN